MAQVRATELSGLGRPAAVHVFVTCARNVSRNRNGLARLGETSNHDSFPDSVAGPGPDTVVRHPGPSLTLCSLTNGGPMDGYYAWMIVATALVLMMTTPALALFYGGMSRSKSVLNMMMMSYVALAVVGIVFVLWGWSMGWGGDGIGNGNGKLIASPFNMFALDGVSHGNYIYVLFQLTFAAITAALISGSIADRVKLSSWIVFIVGWVTLAYFPIAHNVWGGGWLYSKFPILDYAGGTVVHINAGIAGGVLALIIGRRIGFMKEPMKPHNLTLTMIGAGLLWFGWYGFNVGSLVFTAGDGGAKDTAQFMTETGVTFVNTTIATMAA